MSIPVIQKDNIGTIFVFTVRDQASAIVNLTTATTLEAHFRKPTDRSTFTRTAVLTTDGSDGKMQYVTVAGDLDVVGDQWERQGFVVLPGVGEFKTNVIIFAVKRNII